MQLKQKQSKNARDSIAGLNVLQATPSLMGFKNVQYIIEFVEGTNKK